MIIKSFETSHDCVVLGHLHDADFIFNRLSFLVVLRLSKFKSEKLTVYVAFTAENSGETACALFANNFVVLGGIFLLDVSSVLNPPSNLTAIFQCLLWLIHLTEYDFKECAWVLRYLFLTEYAHLNL